MPLAIEDLLKNRKIKDIEYKIPNLATTSTLNAKTLKIKGEINNITGLAYTTAFNNVKNNKLNVSALVEKADCDVKIVNIEKKLDDDTSNK